MRIYTDGACKGNPNGPGGYGVVLEFIDPNGETHIKELSEGYLSTTNNRMELMGLLKGLEALKKPCDITAYSDSKYVIDAFNAHWIESWIKNNWRRGPKKEPVKNDDLWKQILMAMKPHQIQFVWVKGHAGHPQNERCDELATQAAESDDLIEDVIKKGIGE